MWASIWPLSTPPSSLTVVFSKDSTSMSKEEVSNHVTLTTDLLLCEGKGTRSKLHFPPALLVPGFSGDRGATVHTASGFACVYGES